MLTKLTIHNFKRFDVAEIELANPVVFIGQNNSGKTTALQALTLWSIGAKRWAEKRQKSKAKERQGVPINRLDLVALPIPTSAMLWRDLSLRKQNPNGKSKSATESIKILIGVESVSEGKKWRCDLEFYYANDEVFYCNPTPESIDVVREAAQVQIAYLPPMSGLAANELRLDRGAINVRIGEGRTAEVLRNLCYQILNPENGTANGESERTWKKLSEALAKFFGVVLEKPRYVSERGEIQMSYRTAEKNGVSLDISSSGRGFQQVLLLLAYMYANPKAILLLDEPDAHLEILRQREVYKMLIDTAVEGQNQLVIATHSEVVLNEAQDRDVVVAFIGKPHRMKSAQQVKKALAAISYADYYQAEVNGWILYLEGATDLAVLQVFAKILNHPAGAVLERPFVHYIRNNTPKIAQDHFHGLREAYPNLVALALFDRLEKSLPEDPHIKLMMWTRREIENYFAFPETLKRFCETRTGGDLFDIPTDDAIRIMQESIEEIVPPIALKNRNDKWWRNTKMSDDFLERVFERYFERLRLPNTFRKTNYAQLAELLRPEEMDGEIKEKLDAIFEVASSVKQNA